MAVTQGLMTGLLGAGLLGAVGLCTPVAARPSGTLLGTASGTLPRVEASDRLGALASAFLHAAPAGGGLELPSPVELGNPVELLPASAAYRPAAPGGAQASGEDPSPRRGRGGRGAAPGGAAPGGSPSGGAAPPQGPMGLGLRQRLGERLALAFNLGASPGGLPRLSSSATFTHAGFYGGPGLSLQVPGGGGRGPRPARTVQDLPSPASAPPSSGLGSLDGVVGYRASLGRLSLGLEYRLGNDLAGQVDGSATLRF